MKPKVLVTAIILLLFKSARIRADAGAEPESNPDSNPDAGAKPVIITEGAYRRAPYPGVKAMHDMGHVHKKAPVDPMLGPEVENDPLMSSGSNDWPQYKEITREDRKMLGQRQNDKFLKNVPKVKCQSKNFAN